MDRNKLQEEIVNAFCDLTYHRGLAVLATSTGKSRIALLIIKKLKPKKILFLTNSTINRDKTMKDEFIKWKMKTWLRKTEFATYQLAYKWRKETKDLSKYLIIADEFDFAATDEFGRFFYEYKDVPTLAMTGYITDEKYMTYKFLLPKFVNITAQQMQDDNVLNRVNFKFIQFALSKEVSRKVEYTKFGKPASFISSENEVYLHFFKQEKEANAQLVQATTDGDIAKIAKYQKVLSEYIPRNRAAFLHTLDSSADLAKKLMIQLCRDNYGYKVISFSERTSQADSISSWAYHGNMDKKTAATHFEKFEKGIIKELSVCSKVNRGVNIYDLKFGILESYTSSTTDVVQKIGRLMRLDKDDVGTLYIFLPYYTKNGEAYPTRAVTWARKMYHLLTDDNYEIFNYCGTKIIHK